MRNTIHVTNQIHADAIVKNYDVAISLGWDTDPANRKVGCKHLFIDVDDIEFADLEGKDRNIYLRPKNNFVIPNAAIIAQIIDFARTIQPGEKVLINCHAGYSRSPATAIIVLVTLGIKTFIEAKETILEHSIPPEHYTAGVKPNDIMLHQFLMRD